MTATMRGRLDRLSNFLSDGGHCFTGRLATDAPIGDSPDDPFLSRLLVFENGIEMGPPHSVHELIRTEGRGRFSHWGDMLLFSSSDNSDPRTNGRDYQVYLPLFGGGQVERATGMMASLPEGYSPQQAYVAVEQALSVLYPNAKIGEDLKSFWNESDFITSYRSFAGDNYRALERKYTVYNLVRSLYWLEGDIVECGVYNGGTAYFLALASEQGVIGRNLYLFDSFEGLSEPSLEDGEYWHRGALACSEETARRNLSEFRSIHFLRGWIPSRFMEVADRKFCFVHIDVDILQPTRDSLDFFYPRLLPGGMLICDDYGFDSCPGARHAMDEFFGGRRERIIHLPTGQGLVIKI